jgi:hypothetical protein
MTAHQRHLSLVSVVDQPRVDVLVKRYADWARKRVWPMTPAGLAKFLALLLNTVQASVEWQARRAETRSPVRPSRRVRYAARCSWCIHPATRHFKVVRRPAGQRLTGACASCWAKYRQATSWELAYGARRSLVWRNIPRGELRTHLLRWVWAIEQARADRTWRAPPPEPPGPPGPPTNGGTRRRAPLRSTVVLDLFERAV